MKLLGLRLCDHDSNMTYFDGEKLHYYKSERDFGIKHHAFNDLTSWTKIIKNIWGVSANELDDVAIVVDAERYGIKLPNDFFPTQNFHYMSPYKKAIRLNHHYAHALSCFPLIKEKPKYDIVIDGYGDWDISWTVFKDGKKDKVGLLSEHGSIGVYFGVYGKFFDVQKTGLSHDNAGKLMGLQAFGNHIPQFRELLRNHNMYSIKSMFNFQHWINFIGDSTVAGHRKLEWLRTIHDTMGDILLKFFEDITEKDYDANITYSGGVAQNVVWNTILKNKFKNLVIPPHCADDGLSLGAIEFLRMKHNLPTFELNNFPFSQMDESPKSEASDETISKAVDALISNKIVGWYQGNGELGARALGHRSVLMDPRIPNGKNYINTIKQRENYRPFGCSILEECVEDYIENPMKNPHMLYIGRFKSDEFKSVEHVDGTTRYQTVNEKDGVFYKLLKEFYKRTSCPLLLNTSLNINGRPIVSTIKEAIEMYNTSDMHMLVVGNGIHIKEDV